jgi:hypothetical protein
MCLVPGGHRIRQELLNPRHFRRHQEVVVAVAGDDGEPRRRQLRIYPTWFVHAATEKREEFGDVLCGTESLSANTNSTGIGTLAISGDQL